MKSRLVSALALALVAAPLAAAPAFAAEPAQFRTAAPQTFTSQDLQRYGLDKAAAERAAALQKQGYEVKVLTPTEAQQYTAGITDNQWLLIGILAGVVVIALAVD